MMQNQTHSLIDLFQTSVFQIPPYQRTYTWDEKNWQTFLQDLAEYQEHKTGVDSQSNSLSPRFFLGTLLLRDQNKDGTYKRYDIVDGQQRLTTITLLIKAALEILSNDPQEASNVTLFNNIFIRCSITQKRRLHTIETDDGLLENLLMQPINISNSHIFDTPSQRRLSNGLVFFYKNLTPEKARGLLSIIQEAQVLMYVVGNDAEATQIFEFQNDRGKTLSDLDRVKSFLMHRIYLDSSEKSDDLKIIQENFSKLFRLSEKMEGMLDALSADDILSNHCVAYLPWDQIKWSAPPDLIKRCALTQGKDKRPEWVKNFTNNLVASFSAVHDMLEARDKFHALANISVLGRFGAFWPLFIKSYLADLNKNKDDFSKITDAAEKFLLKSIIAGKRSDAGLSECERHALSFKNDFIATVKFINELSNGWEIPRLFQQNLDSPSFYEWAPAAYLLWRYENYLRSLPGNQWSLISWREMKEPSDSAKGYCVDHIAPRENNDNNSLTVWDTNDPNENPRPFKELYLNKFGNLVLDSRSAGASKGKKLFKDRIYASSTLLSQKELSNYATKDESLNIQIWREDAIRTRHQKIIKWILSIW
jgi:hypothetical protein